MKRKPALEVRRTLILSTAHISAETHKRFLTMQDPKLPMIAKHEYGWYLWVPQRGSMGLYHGLSDDVLAILKFARAHDCQEVKLDSDGPVVDGLPTFEW